MNPSEKFSMVAVACEAWSVKREIAITVLIFEDIPVVTFERGCVMVYGDRRIVVPQPEVVVEVIGPLYLHSSE
jgi:hypothetical protein